MPELSTALLGRIAVCFALGSIPFAVVSMWGTGVDITTFGSGNPGFNNVLRYSKVRAIFCLIGDVGKGLLATWLFARPGVIGVEEWLFGMAAVIGHCFSPWLKFKGGKGIATAAGVMLYLYPVILLPCVMVYVALRFIGGRKQWKERGFIASISASILFTILLLSRESMQMAALGVALLAFVAWRHKRNIQVLADPTASH